MVKIYCDNCKEELKDFSFTFEALVRSIDKISQLVGGILQERQRLKEEKMHLCQKCYNKKFK